MNPTSSWQPFKWAGVVVVALACLPPAGQAAEPAQEFLEALRERGYHDMALEYLDRMQQSRLVPVQFREVLLYERGKTLIEMSKTQRDVALREKQLDQAQSNLQQFVGQRPDHPLVSSAQGELGNLLVERGRMKVEQSKKGDRQKLLGEAKGLYEEAYKVFLRTQNDLRENLARMPKVLDERKEQKEIELRDQLRRAYLESQLLAAAVLEETADTVDKDSDQYNELLEKAAKEYEQIYEKYRTRVAGLYARMYQGRCLQKQGNLKDALSYYADLLDQPDNPQAFRTLKTKALLLALDCWMDDSQKKYSEAVARGSEWVSKAGPNEARDPEWLELRMKLARANMLYAEELEQENPKDRQIKLCLDEARRQATVVSRTPGDLQQRARELLASLPGGPKAADDKPEPKTFVEAKTAGKEALDSIQVANLVLRDVPARLKSEKDEGIRKELQQQLDDARQTANTARHDAIDYYRLALELADEEIELEDVNIVRYFLCFLYYSEEDYYESAVLGEFLARHYPNSSGARQSAKIALASYLKLYGDRPADDRDFETARLMAIADYIVETWQDQPEAIEAINTLIPFVIQQGDLDRAQQYLAKIPDDSPQRGEVELKIGQAMWGSYLRGMQELREWDETGAPQGVDVAAKSAELETLKDQAQQTLTEGIARMQEAGSVNQTVAMASLSLAQIYVDTEQAAQAVQLLEDPKVGPLGLVQKKHPAASRQGYAQETYKTALRAYIASLASGSDGDALIEKAEQVMDSLKDSVGSTPADQRRLIAIYMSLARDLKQQMDLIQSPEDKRALSKGFETFLQRVGAGAEELNVLNWVAETFYGMGETFDTGSGKPPAQAQKYYGEAARMYQNMLDRGQQNASFLEPQIRTQLRMRLAMTKRRMGQFEEAVDIFEEMLTENNMMLHIQIEAARTFQQWGAVGDPKMYDVANKGARPGANQQNVIWGWIKLANITGRQYSRFGDAFHEATYNRALCQYRLSQQKDSSADKTRFLQFARNSITVAHKLYPDMGGERWKPRYDALLKNIQREMGQRPVGLPEGEPERQVRK